jgi:hypothetical protein
MRTIKGPGILLFILMISCAGMGQAFQQPILISSAGQSADVKLVSLLASREKLDAVTIPLANADDLEGIRTLVIVPGFSSKGLGAAGVSQEQEMERVKALLDAAQKVQLPIVLVHLGGSARRQGQSDAFNALAGKNSRHMIVVSQGNEDGFFSDIASAGKIPLELVENMAAAAAPLGALFK